MYTDYVFLPYNFVISQLTEISQTGVYPRTKCLDALDKHDGNVKKALNELEREAMAPLLQRVLDSCLPDDALDEPFLEQSRMLNTQTSQEKATFEATVSDRQQNVDVSTVL